MMGLLEKSINQLGLWKELAKINYKSVLLFETFVQRCLLAERFSIAICKPALNWKWATCTALWYTALHEDHHEYSIKGKLCFKHNAFGFIIPTWKSTNHENPPVNNLRHRAEVNGVNLHYKDSQDPGNTLARYLKNAIEGNIVFSH